MRLQPTIPLIELAAPPFLLFFAIKVFVLGLDANNLLIVATSLLFFLAAVLVVYWVNANFKSLDLTDSIKINGYFWGHDVLEFRDIKGYKLIQVGRTRKSNQHFTLVFIDTRDGERSKLSPGDYKTELWEAFISELDSHHVEFLGEEITPKHLSTPWERLKHKYFK